MRWMHVPRAAWQVIVCRHVIDACKKEKGEQKRVGGGVDDAVY